MSALEQMVYDAIYKHKPVIINRCTYREGIQFGDISFQHYNHVVYYKEEPIGEIFDKKLKRKIHNIFYGINNEQY